MQTRPIPALSSTTSRRNNFPIQAYSYENKIIFSNRRCRSASVAGIAADASDSQDALLNKLLTEMNSAPSDQKISAIVTLLNKLVEQRETAPVEDNKRRLQRKR